MRAALTMLQDPASSHAPKTTMAAVRDVQERILHVFFPNKNVWADQENADAQKKKK